MRSDLMLYLFLLFFHLQFTKEIYNNPVLKM